jgi:sterol carrier protein 2
MCAIEDLGLAKHGEGWKLVQDGGITYAPDPNTKRLSPGWVINPSGGLISKGHPLGTTGLAQTAELGMYKSSIFLLYVQFRWIQAY